MDRGFTTDDSDDIDLSALADDTTLIIYGWVAMSDEEFTVDYDNTNLVANTASPGVSATFLSSKTAFEALTEDDDQAIRDWESTLDSRNPVPTVIVDDDDDDDVPDAASYMTVAAATITALGAILI